MKAARRQGQGRRRVARYLVLLVGCLSFASGAHAQSSETTHSFAWSYPDQWIAQFGVVEFEIRINEGGAHSGGMSALATESQSYSTPIPSVEHRASEGMWYLLNLETGSTEQVRYGEVGDIPVGMSPFLTSAAAAAHAYSQAEASSFLPVGFPWSGVAP